MLKATLLDLKSESCSERALFTFKLSDLTSFMSENSRAFQVAF